MNLPNRAESVTRLAPSPTGALHLGNAKTFLLNWALARQRHWQIVLRIDDLDGPRIKPGTDRAAIDCLRWLGIDWDTGPIYETQYLADYQAALAQLAWRGCIYPCRCSRTQIELAQIEAALSAPQDGHELVYPGSCRPAHPAAYDFADPQHAGAAWRFRVPDQPIAYHDQFAGPQSVNLAADIGDFLVANRQHLPSYQLAVVIDDQRAGVTDVVRGQDLIPSTPRQILLRQSLYDAAERVRYWHLPLVVGPDGRRLAKRHGDTRISFYREQGVSAERVVGLIAYWCGHSTREPMSAHEFAEWLQIATINRNPAVFTQQDHDWLCH